ncbi:MAG: lipopolysaccharide biosynthesis protein [Phycisphaerales bacterium]|nr:lipopolysaccharide biosynthesis protein [Hyphomonadaceae bacterium]
MKTGAEARAERAWFGWADTPRLSLADLAAMLWTERFLVLSVGGAICALGLVAALTAPKTYTARSELLVRLGQEYVYQPTAGGAGAGATPDMQTVVNAEMRMIGSGSVVRSAIQSVGLATLYPDIAAAPGADARKLAAAERAFAQHLTIETAPQTPAIGLSFEHRDPDVAARALNALVEQYLTHRRDVLVGGEFEALSSQTTDLSTRAGVATAAMAAFLTAHEIGDFESELAALAARAGDIETQLLTAQTQRGEAEARASSLRARYQSEPEEIQLYSESDARRELVEAQVERQQLLSRYQEDALPVREVDRRIAQLEGFLAGGDPASITRRGANPVRQDVASQLYGIEAEARAQRGREQALTRQRQDVRDRLRAMQALEPQFRQLQRERAILEASVQNFATRAEDARARSQMLGRATDNISSVQRAEAPSQGKSLRWPIMIVTLLIAFIVALAAGLSRGLMRRSFPTPSSAARALEAPVLAVMPRRAPAKRTAKPVKAAHAPKAQPKLTLVEGGA